MIFVPFIRTYPITLDACHRVLVADATEAQKWGIMVRQLPGAQKGVPNSRFFFVIHRNLFIYKYLNFLILFFCKQ